mgnify:CR=1 FL=1
MIKKCEGKSMATTYGYREVKGKGMEIKNKGLLIFGAILLVTGLVASFYKETHHIYGVGDVVVIPYQTLGIVLVLAGIIFVALGFLYPSQRTPPPPPQKT